MNNKFDRFIDEELNKYYDISFNISTNEEQPGTAYTSHLYWMSCIT